MFAMGEKLRALPLWREIDVFAKLRPHCVTEIEQDEEHCLEAMIHWRDPVDGKRKPPSPCELILHDRVMLKTEP